MILQYTLDMLYWAKSGFKWADAYIVKRSNNLDINIGDKETQPNDMGPLVKLFKELMIEPCHPVVNLRIY